MLAAPIISLRPEGVLGPDLSLLIAYGVGVFGLLIALAVACL